MVENINERQYSRHFASNAMKLVTGAFMFPLTTFPIFIFTSHSPSLYKGEKVTILESDHRFVYSFEICYAHITYAKGDSWTHLELLKKLDRLNPILV